MATKKKVNRSAPRPRPSPRRAPTRRRQPESCRARGLSTGLTVNDLQRSIAWYRDVLRFTVKDRWEDGGKLMGVELVAGSASVMLNQDDFAKGRDRTKGIGLRLWPSTIPAIVTLAQQINGRGGVLHQG